MSTNYVLLYNYGAYLNQISEYNKSNQIFNECSRYFNSSEMQLFFADNYLHLKEYARALKHADLAHDMVPSRFYPLYYKYLIAIEEKRIGDAVRIAQEIVDKEIKIDNQQVQIIKSKMKYFLQQHKKGKHPL